jgi:hypothetical protein
MQNYTDLIDHAQIAAAQDKLDALLARRKPAADAMATADAAHVAAKRDYDAALIGDGDANAARQAMDDAERRVATARDVPPALEAGIHRAEADLRQATSRAMAPAMGAAVLARLAAAKRADAARAELAAAKADHTVATAAIRQYGGRHHDLDASSGSLTPFDGTWTQPTFAEDLRRFALNHGYFLGLDEAGNVKS